MRKSLRLRISPHWSLDYDGEPVNISAHRARALVSYLVLESAAMHNREKLASLFWDTADAAKARASLRQIISSLKRSFSKIGCDAITISKREVGFADGSATSSFEIILTDIESGVVDPDRMREMGNLRNMLTEFDDLGEEFVEWARETRAFYIRRAIDRLKAVFTDRSRPTLFRNQIAETASMIDELDEDAIRTLMSTHAELENSVVALKVYGDFCQRLEEQLDAEPSIETQDLVVKIKLSEGNSEFKSAASEPVLPQVSTALPVVTVAVLPFEFLGPATIPDFVQVGLLDHITCQLAVCRAPAVISSNTTRKYLGQTPQPSDVGRELGSNYVVSGSLKINGDDTLITVQLANAGDNRVLWANTHSCETADLYDLKTPIADDIVRAIIPSVNVAELTRTQSTPTEALEPYHLVLRAKDLIFRLAKGSFDEAGQLLQQAVEMAPYFAPAHALLAEWFAISVWQGWSRQPQTDQIALELHCQRAIALSPGDGRAMSLMGHNRVMFHRAYDEALNLFEHAIELCPNDSETLIWSVPTFALAGQPERAVEVGSKALGLSPLDPFSFRNEHFLGLAKYAAGDFESSAELGLSSFKKAPNYGSNIRATVAALTAAGRHGEALPLVEQHAQVEPGFAVEDFFARQGFRSEEARRLFCDRLIEAGMPK